MNGGLAGVFNRIPYWLGRRVVQNDHFDATLSLAKWKQRTRYQQRHNKGRDPYERTALSLR
jgi:hypothetical protein